MLMCGLREDNGERASFGSRWISIDGGDGRHTDNHVL